MQQPSKKKVGKQDISTKTTYPEKFKEFAEQPVQVQGAPSKLQKSDKPSKSEMGLVSEQQLIQEGRGVNLIESGSQSQHLGEKLPTEIKLS